MEWDTSLDEPGTQYTLMLIDPGYGMTHATYINVPGTDI